MMAQAIASGIDTTAINTLRQLPRNARIMSETSSAETNASRTTLEMAARTNTD